MILMVLYYLVLMAWLVGITRLVRRTLYQRRWQRANEAMRDIYLRGNNRGH